MKQAAQAVRNARLIQARKEQGWSQEDVAALIGTTGFTVCRWERGLAYPSPHYRKKLSEIFAASLTILGLVPQPIETTLSLPEVTESHVDAWADRVPMPPSIVVGRATALDTLYDMAQKPGTLALCGLPGVGKTTIATLLGHSDALRSRYPAGVLWAGLGPHPSHSEILHRWALKVGLQMPSLTQMDDAALALAIHEAIGMHAFLCIIDDAWSNDAALLYKVGGPNCLHIVTTRHPALAHHWAPRRVFAVPELPIADGVDLLQQMLPENLSPSLDVLADIAGSVGGLPLALTLIGHYLYTQAHGGQRRWQQALTTVQEATHRFRLHQQCGPTEYQVSLPHADAVSLADIIAVSIHALTKDQRALLADLARFPAKPASFSEATAGAVQGWDTERFVSAFDALVDVGLVESRDRYSLHQTIADFARLHLMGTDVQTWTQRLIHQAITYAQQHQYDTAQLAVEEDMLLFALRQAQGLSSPEYLIALLQGLGSYLCNTGRPLLIIEAIACREDMEQQGPLQQVTAHIELARAYLYSNQFVQAEATVECGLALAQSPDRLNEQGLLWHLRGSTAIFQGRFAEAQQSLQHALALTTDPTHWRKRLSILISLGTTAINCGNVHDAHRVLMKAVDLARERNHMVNLGVAYENLGVLATQQGDYIQAHTYFSEAAVIAQQSSNSHRRCWALSNLGEVQRVLGKYVEATASLHEAEALARDAQNHERLSNILINLAEVAFDQDNLVQAQEFTTEGLAIATCIGQRSTLCTAHHLRGLLHLQQRAYAESGLDLTLGLAIAREIGHPWLISRILVSWGEWYLAQAFLQPAYETLNEALTLAQAHQSRYVEALIHFGLARLAAAHGDAEEARKEADNAERLLVILQLPLAEKVQSWSRNAPLSRLQAITPQPEITLLQRFASHDLELFHLNSEAPVTLSKHELQILQLVDAGLSNQAIAQHQVVSIKTVQKHLENIYRKLQVHNRTAALAKARHLWSPIS